MAKPPENKIVRLLEQILARLKAMDDLSPKLAVELDTTRRLALKLDRMVPDRPTTKGD